MDPRDRYKEQAALQAVAQEVRDGMVVGLGTGTTAAHVLSAIGRLVREQGWRLRGVPTSDRTAAEAERLGIPLTTLDATPDVDLDGADQVDPGLNLIKGGGGAHVREKLVALASRRVVIVADSTKAVARLCARIPLEVLPFGLPWVLRVLPARIAGSAASLRMRAGQPVRSDGGNFLVDLVCGPLADPAGTAAVLDGISGVVDHGLFVGIADVVYLAGPDGARCVSAERGRL
jgi:ribose 5-phosphate isomerase A